MWAVSGEFGTYLKMRCEGQPLKEKLKKEMQKQNSNQLPIITFLHNVTNNCCSNVQDVPQHQHCLRPEHTCKEVSINPETKQVTFSRSVFKKKKLKMSFQKSMLTNLKPFLVTNNVYHDNYQIQTEIEPVQEDNFEEVIK